MTDFMTAFNAMVAKHNPDFDVRGMVTRDSKIYQLGTDTKVLSSVFELIVRPLIIEIAADAGLVVYEPPTQNSYPDFTLMQDKIDSHKVAVDVKTTYRHFRKDGTWSAAFTLGGYTSFLRKERKNIAFPYSEYAKHYIIGFIYTRALDNDETDNDQRIFSFDRLDDIPSPITDVAFFVQEKHRIAADYPGSGNTTNIASISAPSIESFATGDGPFASLGEEVFVDYWRHYGKTTFQNLAEYEDWKLTQE